MRTKTKPFLILAGIIFTLAICACKSTKTVTPKPNPQDEHVTQQPTPPVPPKPVMPTASSYRTGVPYEIMRSAIASNEYLRTSDPENYVQNVCNIILENAKNDFERVKMANDFVALLIRYDDVNYWNNTVPRQDWQYVLASRRAVCEGYSTLLKKFFDTLGLKNEKVSGYGRGVGFSLENERIKTNHAWNLVWAEGSPYLVDCTWNSGYMQGRNSVQEYRTDYLLCSGKEFIYTHFPEDAQNQLLDSPLSQEDFTKLPYLLPTFFDGVKLTSTLNRVNYCNGEFSMYYTTLNNTKLSYTVNRLSGNTLYNTENTEFIRNGVTMFAFPQAGTYEISIFKQTPNDVKSQYCGKFCVVANRASAQLFPKFYSTKNEAELISPLRSPLKAGSNVTFSIKSNCSEAVVIVTTYKDEWNYLRRGYDGSFSGNVYIPYNASSVRIYIKNYYDTSYTEYTEYDVQ